MTVTPRDNFTIKSDVDKKCNNTPNLINSSWISSHKVFTGEQ